MDVVQFLAEFGHIANAPGGVARLREVVLRLAVEGKLAAASGSIDASDALLRQVRSIKAELVAERTLPREKPFPEVTRLLISADCPEHWQWACFGELWQLLSGRDLQPNQYNDKMFGIPYVTGASSIVSGEIEVTRWTPEPVVTSVFGDLLITCKGTIGKTAFNKIGDAHIARQIMAIRDFSGKMDIRFLKLWLDGFVDQLTKKSKSMIPGFSRDDLVLAFYPIFPIEEQSRIVAKVDELMDLCNDLEKQQQARRKIQNALRKSTLQALASAKDTRRIQENWQRLKINFGRLFAHPEDIRDFRGLILDLAVSGYLLPTKNTTISAADLIEEIARTRTEWAKTAEEQERKEAVAMLNKLRKQQVILQNSGLPEHWCSASLLQISQAVVDCHNKTAPYVAEGIHLIRTTDIRDGRMDLRKTKKISEETYEYWARRLSPKPGDIFFTREAPMGEAAIVPEGERVCLGQRSMLIRLFPKLFSNRYLLYVIQSPRFQSRLNEAAIGMTVKHLRVGGVEDLIVPVPPRAEQDQIVELVDRMFELCDRYAEYLGKSRLVASKLSSATATVFTGFTPEQEEKVPVKVPQTELIAPLRLGKPPRAKTEAPLARELARHNGELPARDLWQRVGGEIDAFYAQLKHEVAQGWIQEPGPAEMRVIEA